MGNNLQRQNFEDFEKIFMKHIDHMDNQDIFHSRMVRTKPKEYEIIWWYCIKEDEEYKEREGQKDKK